MSDHYKRHDIPYECTGTFVNGDKALIIHGTLKQMDQWRMRSVVLSGRFKESELSPISKQDADELLKQLES